MSTGQITVVGGWVIVAILAGAVLYVTVLGLAALVKGFDKREVKR